MKTMFKLAVVVAALGLLASPALANPTVKLNNPFGAGGAFVLTFSSPQPALHFGNLASLGGPSTFCVDSASFDPNKPYYFHVDSTIELGSKTLTSTTKNLFAAYVFDPTLAAYMTTGTAAQIKLKNQSLQEIFWTQQGVVEPAQGDLTIIANLLANWGGPNAKAGGVMALNLWKTPTLTGDVQSQLVWVPVPGAALLCVIGIGLVGWVKRRFA